MNQCEDLQELIKQYETSHGIKTVSVTLYSDGSGHIKDHSIIDEDDVFDFKSSDELIEELQRPKSLLQ